MSKWEKGLAIPAEFDRQQGLRARFQRPSLLHNIAMLDLPYYLARTQGELAVSLSLLAITAIETIVGLEVDVGIKKKRLLIRMLDWFAYFGLRLWKRDQDPNWLLALNHCHRALAILTGRSPFGSGLTVGGAGVPLTAEQGRMLRLALDWLRGFLEKKTARGYQPLPQEKKLVENTTVWLAAQSLEGMAAGKVLWEGQLQELDWSRLALRESGLIYGDRPSLVGPASRQKLRGAPEQGYLETAFVEMSVLMPEVQKLLSDLLVSPGGKGGQWPVEGEGEVQIFLETPAGPAGLDLKLQQGKVAALTLYTPDRFYSPLLLAALQKGLLTEEEIYQLVRDWSLPIGLVTGGSD